LLNPRLLLSPLGLLLHSLLLLWGLLRTLLLLLRWLRALLLLLSRSAALLLSLFVILMLRINWYHRSHTQEDGGGTRYTNRSHGYHSYSPFVLARQMPSAAPQSCASADGRCRAHRQQYVTAPLAAPQAFHLPL
jgi:glucan phosphoethanolaminetransferase (alkaline phosphatase superfamily)